MPDVQEVFRMSTQKVKPDPGALERQQTRQRRRSVGKKLGALAVAAAIGLGVLAVIWAAETDDRTRTPADDATTSSLDLPTPVTPAAAIAEKAASDFLEAYGAFDAKEAMTYVAEDADLGGLLEQVPNDVRGLSLWLSFLEGQRFEHTVTSCRTTQVGSETRVRCDFDFHLIRSQELGRGPYTGSVYTFTVRDGQIVRAALSWDTEEFSPEMWEPFADWVATEHPKDVEVMYSDASQTNFRLSLASIRLWELRSKEYVKAVRSGDAQ